MKGSIRAIWEPRLWIRFGAVQGPELHQRPVLEQMGQSFITTYMFSSIIRISENIFCMIVSSICSINTEIEFPQMFWLNVYNKKTFVLATSVVDADVCILLNF